MELLNKVYYGNSVLSWLTAVITAAVIFGIFEGIRIAASRRIRAGVKKMPGSVGDSIVDILEVRTKPVSIAIFALYVGSTLVSLPKRIAPFVNDIAVITFAIQVGIWGNGAIAFIIEARRRKQLQEDATDVATHTALNFAVRVILWSLIMLITLDNLGINITTLIAGLGIGGVAGALAMQNILGDLFASIAIVLDKPFQVGDFVNVDDYMGAVEHIGIKTTRVRSLSGELIIFSNTDLLKSRVRNFKQMSERRAEISLSVSIRTPEEKLVAIPDVVREVIEGIEQARFERAHLKKIGESVLTYEIIYHVKSPSYNVYMDIQQKVNLGILKNFNQMEIKLA